MKIKENTKLCGGPLIGSVRVGAMCMALILPKGTLYFIKISFLTWFCGIGLTLYTASNTPFTYHLLANTIRC